MKKIEFGFNNDDYLNGQWGGRELYDGEYLDMFSYEGMDFLVTKIIDANRVLGGNIDVRELAQDYYPDGTCIMYANKQKNATCQKLQELLNQVKIKEKINNDKLLIDILKEEGIPAGISNLLDITAKPSIYSPVITSIRNDVFKTLKESKTDFRGISMYNLCKEILRLEAENQKLKDANSKNMDR